MGTHHETIVIGGGISGLACARRLHDAGRDFLLVAQELGGRMRYDEKTGVNLGAGIILSNNAHILRYVGKRRPISARSQFLCDKECVPFPRAVMRSPKDVPKLLKLLFIVWSFNRRIQRMGKRLAHEQFKDALAKDKVLLEMFSTPAGEFVREHGLERITRECINPVIASTFYTTFEDLNAFYYLATLIPIFSTIYIPDFTQTVPKLSAGFEGKIRIGKVVKVTRSEGMFSVRTSKGTFTAAHVVFAAPEESLRGVYAIPRPRIQQHVHRFVVQGKRREEYEGKATVIFAPERHDILKMSSDGKGHDIIASPVAKPDFSKYYSSYEIVAHVHWRPATIVPDTPLPQDLGHGAYLASDYNLCSLETSFVAGLYAANRIIEGAATQTWR